MGRQFLVFLLCGGLAALANITSRWILSHWLSYSVAIILAFCIGLLVGYSLFKVIVFKKINSHKGLHEICIYIIVNLFSLLQTLAASFLLATWILPNLGIDKYNKDIAHILGVSIPAITSYFLHKYYTFKK